MMVASTCTCMLSKRRKKTQITHDWGGKTHTHTDTQEMLISETHSVDHVEHRLVATTRTTTTSTSTVRQLDECLLELEEGSEAVDVVSGHLLHVDDPLLEDDW